MSVLQCFMCEIAVVENGLDDAAQGEETQVGNPQAVVSPCFGREPVNHKKQRPGDAGTDEHAHRTRQADEHAVPHKSGHACCRNQPTPHAIVHSGLDDALLVGQQPECHTWERVNQCEHGSDRQPPPEQQPRIRSPLRAPMETNARLTVISRKLRTKMSRLTLK